MSSAEFPGAPLTAALEAFVNTPGPAVSEAAALKDYIALSIAAKHEQAALRGLDLPPEDEGLRFAMSAQGEPIIPASIPTLKPVNPVT